ncbi:hypothetical protein VTH06DRAFT_4460 [Thermothelomyces fergusii]
MCAGNQTFGKLRARSAEQCQSDLVKENRELTDVLVQQANGVSDPALTLTLVVVAPAVNGGDRSGRLGLVNGEGPRRPEVSAGNVISTVIFAFAHFTLADFTMAKFFRGRHSAHKPSFDQSAYLSLLDPAASVQEELCEQSKGKITDPPSRPWMAAAEGRSSWAGERPPTRKLVKEMNGSGPPSSSFELSDSDADKEKGIVRRQLSKLKGLYRREK